jgi:hypothetical protein
MGHTRKDAQHITNLKHADIPMVLTSCVSDILYQLDKLTTLLQVVGKLVTSLFGVDKMSDFSACMHVYCIANVASKVCVNWNWKDTPMTKSYYWLMQTVRS